MTAPSVPPPRAPLAQVALADLDHELDVTRRMLERVPDAHWAWRPHARSWALGQLAAHLSNLPLWGAMTLGGSELELDTLPRPEPPASRDAALARFDGHASRLRAALAEADDARLGGTYTVTAGGHVVAAMPRAAMLRAMVVSHMIHHRGQLTVYLRLLDVPVPGAYGPSADEGRG